jgi:hypothetical protein
MWAAAYVANAVYNPNGSFATAALNSSLFNQGQVSSGGSSFQRTVVMYGGSVPRWANPTIDSHVIPTAVQNGLSPAGTTTAVPYLATRTARELRNAVQYYFPTVPVTPLSKTISQPVIPAAQSDSTEAISASQVAIRARFINVNGTIRAGQAVEVVVTTNETDLDNLASLSDTLRSNGITLPAEIVNEQ